MKQRHLTAAAAAVIIAGVAACGSTSAPPASSSSSSSSAGTPTASASTAPAPVTLEVWLMSGSAPASLVSAWNNEFQQKYPNVTVHVDLQQWTGIVTKTETALATSAPPDVLEMGNTYVASFAATGGLADLSSVSWPNQSTWLQSLQEAGTYSSKLYGVPYYAGDRIAIYNQTIFNKAGISSPPTTTDDLLSDCAKIKAAEPSGTSCLYIPGEYWYAMFSFLFGESGNATSAIATSSGGTWSGGFSSSADQTGLNWVYDNLFKTGYDLAPATQNDTTTTTNTIIEKGQAAIIVEPGWDYGSIVSDLQKSNPDNVQLGSFALPGYSSSAPMPTFLGGSNLGVAAKSPNQQYAEDYIQLVTDNDYESQMATVGGVIPNSTTLLGLQAENPPLNTAAQAAQTSWFTPNTPQEATLENNNVYENLLGAIFSGQQSASAAASTADSTIASTLNGS
ncbi:MAG TPA: extracellular solute-binding protein [Candidatus Binatia bacterium]|nr:extracellular solute-binding protein [Candidatus Binatia bacterium]